MKRIAGLLLACLVGLSVVAPPGALGATTLEVIVFPGGFNWPIWAAMEKGFFAREGIEIKLTPTPNSVFQLTNLIGGKFDIGMTAIDNIVAYQEGQGEAPVSGTPDLFAFMGGDNGFLRLSVVPEVKSFADLRGKELSVDAMTTGYAFVLRKMVQLGGLKEGEVVRGKVLAIDNVDPFSGAAVMSRGIIGSVGETVTVASPVYKQRFDLRTGACLENPDVRVATFPARVVDGRVEVSL